MRDRTSSSPRAARPSTPPDGRWVGAVAPNRSWRQFAAKQFLTYVGSGPFQPATAVGLRLPDSYFERLASDLQSKRDRLFDGLVAAGFEAFRPSGTYFITADIRPIQPDGDGRSFCASLPERCGVVAIPNEVFYADRAAGRHLVRFAFCKRDEVIDEAVIRLKGMTR
ncbi:MAG: aminotransferase class I/II-fold pyridoxal phosphate-dependent enzyme [Ilumatobacteraceae bacterium]